VKAADPSAVVVVGGYDGLFGPPGTRQFPNQENGLAFFDYVLEEGRDEFDLFDLRLYGDPYTIPARVDFMRKKMLALGYDKPIVSTEYGGPNLLEFPQNRQYIPLVSSWTQSVVTSGAEDKPPRNPIAELYEKMSSLSPQTQMFMIGCPPELEAKYQRIQARGIVMRNLFALSAGVQKTLYWYLPMAPASGDQRFNVMSLMYGKIGLIELHDGVLSKRLTGADTFGRMTKALAGVKQVRKIDVSERPAIVLFEVDRGQRGPVYVIWEQRDAFTGEDSPDVPFEWSWRSKAANAEDVLGHRIPVEVRDGKLHLSVSLTPIFFEAGR
jgi:hypothetical protein